MRVGLVALGVLASSFAAASPALAWTQIAERIVTDRLDPDLIVLPGPVRYSQIKLCVYRNPVRFYDLDVNFANGGKQDVQVRARINPGACTRDIDLNGADRDIVSIKLLYEETSRRRARGTVRVFAR
ncbi:MAG TPA: hypothetical protein DCL54_08020 [Alphaproteobacteria bacterium]|nr:hypothetical protein [Alphaproteobacteria bacterium]HAJ46511.1 hypothetical protein [Alphaproteobacteria bacterium]